MGDIGNVILENALEGFNGCLFAYGQTGSGKSYSVVGSPEEPGIIPRSVESIFEMRAQLTQTGDVELGIWISYIEIYNETVRDLLAPNQQQNADLKIVDHPKLGVYMPGLTDNPCSNSEEVYQLMEFGNRKRIRRKMLVGGMAGIICPSRMHNTFFM